MGLLDKILKRAKPELQREARSRGIPMSEQEATNRLRREIQERTKKDGK